MVQYYAVNNIQGDHSLDNVKFSDGSRHSSMVLVMLSFTHIMPVLVFTVSGGGRNAWSETIYLISDTEQTPTKYLYGRKYAVQF